MYLFAIIAAGMVVLHVVKGFERPSLALFVSGILWALYTVYEYFIANGTLCEAPCNIRVDLVFFLPLLALATFCAYRAYMGRPGQAKIIGVTLGMIVLFAIGLFAEGYGYGDVAFIGVVLGILALGIYAYKTRRRPEPQ